MYPVMCGEVGYLLFGFETMFYLFCSSGWPRTHGNFTGQLPDTGILM